ncbi:unnamed protein product [Tilletia controversa]|nr:unnamed protein product [Tilletia controversa]
MFGSQSTASPAVRIIASYAVDWVGTLLLAGLLAIINSVDGFRREFSLTDTSIQHTYSTTERVPTWLLAVCSFLVPLVVVGVIGLGVRKSVWDFHTAFLGLVLTHALTLTVTTLVKVTVGRPRPDLIDRCRPQQGATNAAVFGLVTQAICTTDVTDHIIRDGFRSFPSGHASTSFAGLTFLSLYLAGKVHLFDSRGHALGAWIALTPLVGAVLIAVSRTMDYRHHATDVIAGGLLGFWISVAIYFLYYPTLGHPQSHKPWAPRIYHPFSRAEVYDKFDGESADRPHRTQGNGAAAGGGNWGPVPSRSEDGLQNRTHRYVPAHNRDPSLTAGGLPDPTQLAGNGKPVHATGPRNGTHGYIAPVYADSSNLNRNGDGGSAAVAALNNNGSDRHAAAAEEDEAVEAGVQYYQPEFATRAGGSPAADGPDVRRDVELGHSYYGA